MMAELRRFNLDAVTVGCLSALSELDAEGNKGEVAGNQVGHRVAAAPVQTSEDTSGVPLGTGLPGQDGALGFVSRSPHGAYSVQDECRAILLNGQTLRAAARARIEQLKAEQAATLARPRE